MTDTLADVAAANEEELRLGRWPVWRKVAAD